MDELLARMGAAEKEHKEKCAEYDCVIESFVRKLKEARDLWESADARRQELEQQQRQQQQQQSQPQQSQSQQQPPQPPPPTPGVKKTPPAKNAFGSIWR
jgi:hypothetical protein